MENNQKRHLFYLVLFLGIFAVLLPDLISERPTVEEPFDFSGFLGFNPNQLSSSDVPKTSAYYNLTGSKILIDDADPLYNWSKTAAENPWCSGSGTIGDPYVIENVYIDGEGSIPETIGKQHSGNALSIYRSTAYFIVRGCFFTRAGPDEFNSGIYLAYTVNGIIYNNTLSYSNNNIFVNDFSHNTTVLYNLLYHNKALYSFSGRAIVVQFSDDVLVTKNYFSNTITGIQLIHSKRSEVRQNLLNSTYYGFPIKVGVNLITINDSKIVYNVFAGDYTGTTFDVLQTTSSGNTIENNTLSGTIPDLGTPPPPKLSGDYEDLISLADSYSNIVSHNIAYIPGMVDPAIPSFNMFIVLGAIGLVSTLLITVEAKRRKPT